MSQQPTAAVSESTSADEEREQLRRLAEFIAWRIVINAIVVAACKGNGAGLDALTDAILDAKLSNEAIDRIMQAI